MTATGLVTRLHGIGLQPGQNRKDLLPGKFLCAESAYSPESAEMSK